MMHAIGPLQGGRTIVGRGEPGAAVLPVLLEHSIFPDCPRNCERRALFQGPGNIYREISSHWHMSPGRSKQQR